MAEYLVTFALKDAYNRTTRRQFKFDDIDLSAALINAGLFATAYQNISELALVEYRVTDVNPVASVAAAGSNVDEGATFRAQLDTPNKYASVQVPGIIQAARNTDGTIDMSNAQIQAWVAFYESGLVTASDFETVVTIESGKLDK